MDSNSHSAIRPLTPEFEQSIRRNPLLNIDTFVIPSPYIRESTIEKDYDHSFVWIEEGELLGYLLVYSDSTQASFHIYKLVTSPFVRGRGIGTALAYHLLGSIRSEAAVYLYVWEKQTDTLEFFLNKGFHLGETTVYRNLVYCHLSATSAEVLERAEADQRSEGSVSEEIGSTRHDARKTIRLLANMVDMLSIENCGRIIEDINRETRSLVNTLNAFRDSMSRVHDVNVTELVLDRIAPYVGTSPVRCELRLKLQSTSEVVLGNYVNYGRAFVNIVSNALDAIAESERDGILEIKIGEEGGTPYVRFRDNGIGMSPEQLVTDDHGIPAFVGRTTKTREQGEGLGTVQIYSAFGPENITVSGRPGQGTTWKIRFRKPTSDTERWFVRLERRFHEFDRLTEVQTPELTTPRREIIAFIWQTRKIEIFLFDLILQFSADQNIRTIFRTILSFLMGDVDEQTLSDHVHGLRVERSQMKEWLLTTALMVRRRWISTLAISEHHDVRGASLKSYGQAIENVIIFTLNPLTGAFLATDRKLAEHLDFAPYLGGDKEQLLRGEFIGDVNNDSQPIHLGVWTIESDEDLRRKLGLIRSGARTLIDIGVHPDKRLAFYQTTQVRHSHDINSDAVTTFAEFAALADEDLLRFSRNADEEMQSYINLRD
jgi:GNAT superfamily N-acetyltransferase/two-component sensor histidine kinase